MHLRIALRVRLPFCRGLHCRVSLRGWLRLALCRIPFSALRSLSQLRCLVAAGCAVAPRAVLFRLRLRCGHAQSCNAFVHAVRRCHLSLARTVWAVHAPVHVAVFSTSRGSAALLMLPAAISPRAVMARLSACCLLLSFARLHRLVSVDFAHVFRFAIRRCHLGCWSSSWFLRFVLSGCCLHTPRVCAHACAFS